MSVSRRRGRDCGACAWFKLCYNMLQLFFCVYNFLLQFADQFPLHKLLLLEILQLFQHLLQQYTLSIAPGGFVSDMNRWFIIRVCGWSSSDALSRLFPGICWHQVVPTIHLRGLRALLHHARRSFRHRGSNGQKKKLIHRYFLALLDGKHALRERSASVQEGGLDRHGPKFIG